MRTCLTALVLASLTSAYAATPELQTVTEDDVTISVPTAWKHMINADERSILINKDAGTTINVRWYRYKENISVDKMLDKLLSATNESLPVGSATEASREEILEGRGKLMTADFATLGYGMKMGFVVVPHPDMGHISTAVMLAPPDVWTDVEAPKLVATVADSLKAKPIPAPAEGAESAEK